MASGWTNSGIDWTSVATMRESRTEDIVKELYQAVNERDYYIHRIKFIDKNYTINPLISDARKRVENMTFYINSTVKGWLTPISDLEDILTIGNQLINIGSLCCYLDDSYTPTNTPPYKNYNTEYLYGFKNLDYTQGGNFETQYSLDLALLRNPPKRISLEWCKLIYDILKEDLSVSVNNWRAINHPSLGLLFYAYGELFINDINSNDEYFIYVSEDNIGEGAVFQDIEDDLNNNDSLTIVFDSRFESELTYQTPTQNTLRITAERSYFTYNISAHSDIFYISDLNPSSISLGYIQLDQLSVTPFSNVLYGFYKDELKQEVLTQSRINDSNSSTGLQAGTYYTCDDILTNFDNFNIGSAVNISIQPVKSSFFIKFNKEGFLNYYTEP